MLSQISTRSWTLNLAQVGAGEHDYSNYIDPSPSISVLYNLKRDASPPTCAIARTSLTAKVTISIRAYPLVESAYLSMPLSLPKLDPNEEHFRIPSQLSGLTLFLRYLPPTVHQAGKPKIVL